MLYFKRSWQMILMAGLSVLIAGVMFAPTATAGTPGGGKAQPSNPNSPNAYYLIGDGTNNSAGTTFFNSSGGSLYGQWWFRSYLTNGSAVRGECWYGANCWGVVGDSAAYGVVGFGTYGGTYGQGNSWGVNGYSPHGNAGEFDCGYIDCWSVNTNWDIRSGRYVYAKNFFYYAPAPGGMERAVPLAASTQSMISDEGTAQLVNGRAVIQFDSTYASAVNLTNAYQVFVTPNSADTAGLAVINKTATSFEVCELNKGTGNFSFDWRIDAVRQGEEASRMPTINGAQRGGGQDTPVPGSQNLPILNKANEYQGPSATNK